MEINRVYDAFQESKFLNNILSPGNLLFIGEAESINYLKSYAVKHQLEKSNYCYAWQEDKQQKFVSKLQNLKQCRGIVVASIEDESTMFDKIKCLLTDADLEMPILKLFDDLFVNFMAQTNLLESSECNFRKPTVSYGILTLPRSGSTFLCHLLTATEVAGYPIEHLRIPAFTLAKYCNFDHIRLLRTLFTHRISLNGVFGTKFISHFLQDFETLETGLEKIFSSFDKYIYLLRKDKL
ncbi:MAG: Stf0 family sulfotransferase, partial [Xenococcaceae cyanobacterium MO_188.B19]|nr:Stf0 family sulfotransferase [Xenococcaceae cyanobacterium MO_188.B19]